MANFVPLHIITGYSFLKSGLTIKKISNAIKQNDYYGAGICDFDGLFGFPEFSHTLNELNKKYILGYTITVDEMLLSLFAINEDGYRNLIAINAQIQLEDIDLEFLKSHKDGLVCILGIAQPSFKQAFLEGINEKFTKYLAKFSTIFDSKSFYLGIEVYCRDDVIYANHVREFASNYCYETIAFPEIRYLKKKDAIVLRIVDAIDQGIPLVEKEEEGPLYFMTKQDYAKIYNKIEIENTRKLLDTSTFDLFQKRGEILQYTKEDAKEKLQIMCLEALHAKNLNEQKYIDRLNYEIDAISSLGYCNYFLLVQDYVNWAKQNNILVGPGRGSAAASIVSYLLNITEADPIKYDLLFERFLNVNRKTMPDIDVDFMDISRDRVINYMRDKYGKDRVANIVAFQTLKAKQSLRDIAKIYGFPEHHIALIAKEMTGKDLSLAQCYAQLPGFKKLIDSDEYFKTFVSLANKIEGLPRQCGMHAAGVVCNDVSLLSSIPVTIDFEGNLIVQYEAEYLEEQGFLKMDFLSLRNLTVIDYCIDLINHNHPGLNLSKSNIPYDTPEIFEFISKGQNIGLFQIETVAMKRGIKCIHPSCFNDIEALLALNRPGPMEFLPNYAKRRDGLEKIPSYGKDVDEILKDTYGIIVYQEQINMIATKMAKFTPGEADLFRRAISKKNKEVLESSKANFIKGSMGNGYSEKEATTIFDMIVRFANYGFNKAHTCVYSMLTCRMAYLKCKYPLEFYTALLEVGSSSETKFSEYISEINARGFKVLLPDINKSTRSFVISNNSLLFPLTAIREVGDSLVSDILIERQNGQFTSFFDFVARMSFTSLSPRLINFLIDSGCFDCFSKSRESLRASIPIAKQYAEIMYDKNGQLQIGFDSIPTPALVEREDNPLENLDLEYESIGMMLSDSPLSYKKDEIAKNKCISIYEFKEEQKGSFACMVKSKKVINTKAGKPMAFVKVFDQTDEIEVTVFSKTYEECKTFLDKNSLIIIQGKCETNEDEISVVADSIRPLEGE